MTKYVFVTGGVVSSLGKGIAAASLAAILESRGIRVTNIKLDPYINVDPGTMSPFQHGEVYVTDDGAETDLDLGHYERFIDRSLSQQNNITTGRIYQAVIRERGKLDLDDLLSQREKINRQLQEIIDRRFYRQKYNAEQALAGFADAARNETDLEALTAQVVTIVKQTMQPEQVSIWLKSRRRHS